MRQPRRSRVPGETKPVYEADRQDAKPSGPLRTRSVENARNGSMVQDFADMVRLGDEMKRVQTERQLEEEGLVDDPIQRA
ncbi:hypothetical protein [Cohnella sp. GCM10027633]|uniref:hypothetical protein n=1 Tax=unclassified Cohnella TaxID=2636738 RepID=UPI00362C42BB